MGDIGAGWRTILKEYLNALFGCIWHGIENAWVEGGFCEYVIER
jgi:hypothetical protein